MFELGQVVDIHPEANSVDLVLIRGGIRLTSVQVIGGMASSNTGMVDLAMPDITNKADKFDSDWSKTRDMIAVVGYIGHLPAVFGFLFPQVSQLLFEDKERMIYRHASDVYSTIDKDGNTEVYHPSGTYLRIGTAPEHEDLTARDLDKKWKIKRNTTKAVHVHLTVANAGAVKATLNIDPAGNIDVKNAGHTHITTDVDVLVTTPKVKLDTPTTVITGNLSVHGSIASGSNIGATGDVTAGAGEISLLNHTNPPAGGPAGGGPMPALDS